MSPWSRVKLEDNHNKATDARPDDESEPGTNQIFTFYLFTSFIEETTMQITFQEERCGHQSGEFDRRRDDSNPQPYQLDYRHRRRLADNAISLALWYRIKFNRLPINFRMESQHDIDHSAPTCQFTKRPINLSVGDSVIILRSQYRPEESKMWTCMFQSRPFRCFTQHGYSYG